MRGTLASFPRREGAPIDELTVSVRTVSRDETDLQRKNDISFHFAKMERRLAKIESVLFGRRFYK